MKEVLHSVKMFNRNYEIYALQIDARAVVTDQIRDALS